MITDVTDIWVVEYTSLGGLVRTSFFIDETRAQQWYEFCASDAHASPTLLHSTVAFTQVLPAKA
jgi:hypothetical protein